MSLLALLLVPFIQSTPADKQIARCGAVMLAYYESRPEDRWDGERAQALAAASYYVGKLEAALAGVNKGPLLHMAVRDLFESEYNKLKPQDVQAEGKKCLDGYVSAMPL